MRKLALLFFLAMASLTLFAQGNVIKPADAQAMIKAYASAQQATQSMAVAPQGMAGEPVLEEGIAGFSHRVTAVSDLQSVTYPVAAIQLLMAQPGMSTPGSKIRIYKALNRLQQETFVLIGVDAAGSEIMGVNSIVIDNGEPCPPLCNKPDVP